MGDVKGKRFVLAMYRTGEVANLGRERVVKLLLEAGAETQTVNKKGKTARQLAEEVGKERVVEMLDTIQAK